MQTFITNLNNSLENQLLQVEAQETDIVKKNKRCADCLKAILNELRSFISIYNFKDQEEEIYFFKYVKPDFFSKYIYYGKLFNVESFYPVGSIEMQEAYLRNELDKIHYFHRKHFEFYHYYRSGGTHLDDRYFTRCDDDSYLLEDCLMFYIDQNFSSLHDYTRAKIIANDRIQLYLNARIEKLYQKSNKPDLGNIGIFTQNDLEWTESKTALIELIYALCASGALNNGKCEIREITAVFERTFDISLLDSIYRTYAEIKIRSNPTKFLDKLRIALLRKIEEDI
ncbi:MAG: RteC domain-containing protein [Paludibacter sp.]|jgi:hypothetical protein